jgi:hypothetical protein
MNGNLVISTEELFVLSQILKAKYLDYDYIATMEDVMQNSSLKKKIIMGELEKRGILEEDFMGDIEISDEIKTLLSPIFQGEAESDMRDGNIIHKFHFHENHVTYVQLNGKELIIKTGYKEQVEKLAKMLISIDYDAKQQIVPKEVLSNLQVTASVLLRNVVVGKTSNAMEMIKINGAWHVGVDKTNSLVLDRESVKKICRQLLWEE